MINEKTVFVLGAGASCPYGYPSGKSLRKEICFDFLDQYHTFISDKEHISEPEIELALKEVKKFTDGFFKSSTKSIDKYLSRNPQYRYFGKMAIVLRILHAENKSKFREEAENVINRQHQDWYSYLFERMTEDFFNPNQYNISDNKIAFITFNYDRSLEQILYESLKYSFSTINNTDIEKELNKIKITHIFGQIAKLPWQDNRSGIYYKYSINLLNLDYLVKNIRVIYDERYETTIKEARKLISEASQIFFLGFGYAKENLEILNLPEIIKKDQKVYGTAYELTKKEISDTNNIFIQNYIKKYSTRIVKPLYFIEDCDCLSLLKKYL